MPDQSYGESKLMVEKALDWYSHRLRHPVRGPALLHVAGDANGGAIGEHHDPETHLIPLVLRRAQHGTAWRIRKRLSHADGTCIRDYIHVEDLSTAICSSLII
jgi:UDP-glucose 4-epimerase